jgi:TctA family transporter
MALGMDRQLSRFNLLFFTSLFNQFLRRSLILSDGSFMIFLTHPISSGCLVLAAVLFILAAL